MSDAPARDDTPLTCGRPHRPQDCTCCDKGCPEQCGLRTVSASQMSSVVVLVCTLAWFACRSVSQADAETKDFAVDAVLFLLGSVIYYFLGSWMLEEKYISQLRSLKPRYAVAEMVVRVGILMLLGIASLFLDRLALFKFTGVSAELAFLVFIFFCFLVWDLIVALGDSGHGQFDLAYEFFVMDIIGASIVLLALWSLLYRHPICRSVSAIAGIGFVFAAFLRSKEILLEILCRIKNRNLQR